MSRYLAQAGTFLAPASVDSASNCMRQIARWLLANTDIRTVAGINRNAIEDYKVWLADQARQRRAAPVSEHPTPTTPHATRVLRTDHRVGMGRRTDKKPDHRTRHPTTPRTIAPSSSTTATPPS